MGKFISNYDELPIPNKRIYDLVQSKSDGTVKAFAEMIGVKQQVLDRIFKKDPRNGKYPSVSDNIKQGLKKTFGLDDIWLLTGEGEMLNEASINAIVPIANEDANYVDRKHMQPILDIRVSAGCGIGLEGEENAIIEWVSIPHFEGCKGITVYGDSMYDKFKSGDVIFVRPIKSRYDVDFGQCYVIITREDRYIKNLYESPKGDEYVTMVSYNTELNPDGRRKFPDRDIAKEDILFLYKVAGKLRRNQL